MAGFQEAYEALNSAQREAVDYIDGPLLVIAGPGTGKTQLLSARVANILQQTDTPARNVLCLTFTENGAENMRERLGSLIGQTAYDVSISTYHVFGGDLIRRFPQYFTEIRLQNPVDELGRRQIVDQIVDRMRYSNPLKQTRHHEGDLIATISDVKRSLLSAEDLRLIAAENLLFIRQVSRDVEALFGTFSRMPKLAEAVALFEKLRTILIKHSPEKSVNSRYGPLAQAALLSLQQALEDASSTSKTTALTSWKNDWLARDSNNKLTFDGELASKRIQALAEVLDQYQAALAERGLYDFDDMIVRAIEALELHDELRFTLQEQYLYVLLDEFQDTNAAQLKLVELLTNNPISEGRPNVMAVGDDDQAIYAFQGALYSNMLDFYHMYRDVRVINLTENYRSQADIIATARKIADQISARLHGSFDGVTKSLTAANLTMPERAEIDRREFLSSIAQADWIARDIQRHIKNGTEPSEIAILAPRHRQLEPLIAYLNALDIPVRYEKREDILEAPVVKQLITMSRLVLALRNNDDAAADSLWPEVLSYDFWRLPTSSIWDIAWQVGDKRRLAAAHDDTVYISWSRVLAADGKHFRVPALLFLTLANMTEQETGEAMLDYLTGTAKVPTNEIDFPQVYSPLKDYYTSDEFRVEQPELFYETLSHLAVLRARLREHQNTSERGLSLQDIVDFVDMYKAADERMVNTSPYNQEANAVRVMTVFKAKGLEFEHVYLPYLQDDVWGNTSRSQSNRITLPANLAPIRHAGASEDERLRILYVALTRAKKGLHLTSVAQNYSGKASKPLKYLDEQGQSDGTVIDTVLPAYARTVDRNDSAPPAIELLELDWRRRHMAATHTADLHALLEPRLAAFKLSPTHVNQFLDLEYAGPERFFLTTILQFPEAPTIDGQFGTAIHETLEWVQNTVTDQGSVPDTSEALAYFTARMRAKKLTEARTELEIERGEAALSAFLRAQRGQYKPGDKAEVSFRNEGVTVADVQLAGKVDRLEINTKDRTVTVVDYKTGKGYSRWQQDAKLYKYRRQLYAYKLLVESSATYKGYTVTSGRLEFVEPDNSGRINELTLGFEADEMERLRKLMVAIWNHIKSLNFPSVKQYDVSLSGIKQFEQDLIDGNI